MGYGPVKPHVKSAGDMLGAKFGITDIGGYRPIAADMTGHPAGLALDFMCNKSQGNQLAAYAQTNASALSVKYIIWWQQIWSAERASEGWRPMSNRGSPTANHFDHVHISFTSSGSSSPLPVSGGNDGVTITPIGLPGIGAVVDAATAAARIVAWWTNPENVLRVAAFVAGAMLMLMGISRVSGASSAVTNAIGKVV